MFQIQSFIIPVSPRLVQVSRSLTQNVTQGLLFEQASQQLPIAIGFTSKGTVRVPTKDLSHESAKFVGSLPDLLTALPNNCITSYHHFEIMTIPKQFLEYLDHDANEDLVRCKGCKSIPQNCQKIPPILCSPTFISMNCTTAECGFGTWFVCCACKQRFPRHAKAVNHASTKKHTGNEKTYLLRARAGDDDKGWTPISANNKDLHRSAFDNSESTFYPLENSQQSHFSAVSGDSIFGDDIVFDASKEVDEALMASPIAAVEVINDDVNSSVPELDDKRQNVEVKRTDDDTDSDARALDARHDWLAEMLKDTRKASDKDVFDSFGAIPNMQRFWQAEHQTPGGGMVYLVGRAYQRTNILNPNQLPDLPEARWQMQNFMQYVSLSDKQRDWHAEITTKITSTGSDLIKKTRIPNHQELKRFYLSDSQHCLWQSLPIPTIHNIGGISYVNPVDIIRFAYACSLPFDDIVLTKDTDTGKIPGKQYHVADSQKMKDLMKRFQDAQDENGDYKVAVAWCTDWRDGFGANRCKNNRKSVVTWTFSVSPAKDAVNLVGNTFAMALGNKKNTGWAEVEHRVRKDTSVLCDPKKPLNVYHGGLSEKY